MFIRTHLNGHSIATLGGDDAVVPIVVDLVVVDSQEIAVVGGVKPYVVLSCSLFLLQSPCLPYVYIPKWLW